MRSRDEIRNSIIKKIEESGEKDFPIKKKELSPDDPILRIAKKIKRYAKRDF